MYRTLLLIHMWTKIAQMTVTNVVMALDSTDPSLSQGWNPHLKMIPIKDNYKNSVRTRLWKTR